MKCDSCGKEIETTFLGKIKGNYMRENAKTKVLCSTCFKEAIRRKKANGRTEEASTNKEK
ncbi:hypothetical protein M1293_03000 [Candidatus Parvarchaeota archaeon]|nr:hypothetical protein [Candidatus Parvarchaeota archaeon]